MNPELLGKLARIIDILREDGVTHPLTSIEQISYLIYLKLLDDEESTRELETTPANETNVGDGGPLFLRQSKRYRWSQWRSRNDKDMFIFLGDDVFPYMASLVKEEPQVAEYFRDAVLEISTPNILRKLVDEIDGIDFTKLENDVRGGLFEYLLTHIGRLYSNGQFRTPPHIRAMMVEMVDPDLGDTVYDPACGTGGLLVDALEYILARYSARPKEIPIYGEQWIEKRGQSIKQAKKDIPTLQTYRRGLGEKIADKEVLEKCLHGIDVSRQMTRIAKMNLMLHGIRRPEVNRADILSEMVELTRTDPVGGYDVILCNPPFPSVFPKDLVGRSVFAKSRKNELLFLRTAMKLLAVGGRFAIIVPDVLLSGYPAHRELRRKLVEKYGLLAVVSLPTGALVSHPGTKTSVLVFCKPTGDLKKDKVWFYDVRFTGFVFSETSRDDCAEIPDKNDIPDLLMQWRGYKKSGYENPPGVESGILLDPGSEEPRCWWVAVEAIAENDYDLSAMWYKPQIAEKVPDDDPAELIRETLVIGDEISNCMERLLRDVEIVK